MDNNTLNHHQGMSAYDEQEMSVDMLHDEFDHFSKATSRQATPRSSSDVYLRAALSNHSNGGKGVVRNGKPPSSKPSRPTKNGKPNGSAANGPIMDNLDAGDNAKRHMYDNHGFEMQATEI